ncbi:MAG TPA: DMT family transporter [Nitrososphaeraceae archaeon]|nr:DMT family transporter [Nitrososphaeraceae archaeon]
MIRKSWIVFLFAVLLSCESILIEYLTLLLGISPLAISAFSIAISGVLLLLILNFVNNRQTSIVYSSIKDFIPVSIFLSAGIFTWYDAVSRVGASKESLLAGPIEIIAVLFLARILLHEKLNKKQLSGICIALVGFIIVLLSDHNSIDDDDHNYNGIINVTIIAVESLNFSITFGDIEAIISAISFALAVFFLARLSIKYSPLEISGMSLVLSGSILIIVMLIFTPEMSINLFMSYWYIFIIFSMLPLVGTILYVEGIRRIGASLTSTIASSRILLTLIIQIVLTQIGIRNTLPDNIFLALIGGTLGITGIIIIHTHLYFSKHKS